jgi:hypothetical protein
MPNKWLGDKLATLLLVGFSSSLIMIIIILFVTGVGTPPAFILTIQ